jgi:hypothetical protein
MPGPSFRLLFAASVLLLSVLEAAADCVEEPRKVGLDAQNVVRLRAYRCGTGPGRSGAQIRVEFHRLSETPASMLVGGNSSTLLRATIGTPKVLRNEVFDTYADLLRQFGETSDAPKKQDDVQVSLSIATPGGAKSGFVQDRVTGPKIRTFRSGRVDFPAAAEIAMLRTKTIPAGMKFYYTIPCEDDDGGNTSKQICRKFDADAVKMMFWRGMRTDDVVNYPQKIKDYNALLESFRTELHSRRANRSKRVPDPWSDTGLPAQLRLLKHVAGDALPEDFAILESEFTLESCEEGLVPGIGGWSFGHQRRDVLLDVMLVENVSAQPLPIKGLLGTRSAEPRLRVVTSAAAPSAPLGAMTETLAPGERLLVPTRINFIPAESLKQTFSYRQTAETLVKRFGTIQFKGNASDFSAPALRDYVFGPALTVTGILVDGKRIEFAQRSANFVDVTFSGEIGSCPYLSSYDSADGDWTNHGKVLHRAIGKPREETESRSFAGFRSRFRLEEREPEVAHIDHAALHVMLASGEMLQLDADHPGLAARDGDYVQLFWGEAIEFAFKLPDGTSSKDVVASRLELTGYYERYSSLLTAAAPSGDPRAGPTLWPRMGPAGSASAACPVPPARPAARMSVAPVD